MRQLDVKALKNKDRVASVFIVEGFVADAFFLSKVFFSVLNQISLLGNFACLRQI